MPSKTTRYEIHFFLQIERLHEPCFIQIIYLILINNNLKWKRCDLFYNIIYINLLPIIWLLVGMV